MRVQVQGTASPRPTGWIISPLADMILLVATPLAIVPFVGFAARTISAETIFLFVAALASIGHHLPGFLRAYGDPVLFQRFRWRFLLAPPLVAAAATLFAVYGMHGLDLILMLWATWHIVMQTYGMMRIYDLKRGVRDAVIARFDLAVCLAVFAAGIVFSQNRLYSILVLGDRIGLPLPPAKTLAALQWGIGIAVGLVLFAYTLHAVFQAMTRRPSWLKIVLLLTTGWLYWICGSVSVNLLIGVAMFEIFHAIQYDALVWSYNRRMAERAGDRLGPLRFLFAKGWRPLAAYLAAIVAFGSIKWVAEAIDPSAAKTSLLILLFTSTMLHFYFDGFIWKVSERVTQQNLGIEGSGRRRRRVPALMHAAKWAAIAAAGLLLFWIETARPLGNAADEQAWVAEALTSMPDVPELLVRNGDLSLARGDLTNAMDSARHVLRIRPASADGQLLLAKTLIARREFPAARDAAKRAMSLDPTSSNATYQFGLASVQLRDFPAAERALRRAAGLNPKYAQTQFQLGNVYFMTRRFGLAEQSYRRAVALAPYLADGHCNLGAVLLQLGRVAEAKDALLAALECGDNPQCHYNLGLILLIEGDAPQARRHLRRARDLGQDMTPEIRQAAGL
ncbi:MAG TPA: tetratricopeptide repeat protein [Pirellulales bacterium]|nr:tetratricopeptide repeat protein [Pirellulales bacterium]